MFHDFQKYPIHWLKIVQLTPLTLPVASGDDVHVSVITIAVMSVLGLHYLVNLLMSKPF